MKDKFTKWEESNHSDIVDKFLDKTKQMDEYFQFAYEEWEGYNNQEPPDREDR